MTTVPTHHIETLIIGAGLSGLYAASLLAGQNKPFIVLEARDRLGGRILSPSHEGYACDLGPAWYWPDIHPHIAGLIGSLGLTGYRQHEDGMGRFQQPSGAVFTVRGYGCEPASWRVRGGMAALISRLGQRLPKTAVLLNHPVCGIERLPDGLRVTVGELEKPPRAHYFAQKAILALPPRLTASTILFTPDLSDGLTQAMLKTGTWMAGQAKFFALYKAPFWREAGLSGQAFSQCGPLGEIHDGSNHHGGPFGLNGFLGIPAVQRNQRKGLSEAILRQLVALFGPEAATPLTLFYQDWAREPFTATTHDQPPMTVHPVYRPPAGRSSIWDGTLHFAGTETADLYGGYLEGALNAAQRAVSNISK